MFWRYLVEAQLVIPLVVALAIDYITFSILKAGQWKYFWTRSKWDDLASPYRSTSFTDTSFS